MSRCEDHSALQSLESEEQVVGGVLVHPARAAAVLDLVRPEDLTDPALRAVYGAIVELVAERQPVDAVLVGHRMHANGTFQVLNQVNGLDFLYEAQARVVTVENIAYHAKVVASKARRRRVRSKLRELERRAADGQSDDAEYLAHVESELVALARTASGTGGSTEFDVVRIGDVPDDGPPKFVVDGLWLEQGVGIVGGDPKSLKSFFTMFVAVHVAAGVPLFGSVPVRKGRVLIYNAEDRTSLTRHRVAGICRALDLDIETLDLHVVNAKALFVDDRQDVARLRDAVERIEPTLLILDPLRNLHMLDENDSKILPLVLQPLRMIQRDYGCAIQVVHHVVKNSDGLSAGGRIRGSGAIRGWYDSAWIVDRDGPEQLTLEVEHRGADGGGSRRIAFHVMQDETGADQFWFDRAGESAKVANDPSPEDLETDRNLVISRLTGVAPPGLSANSMRGRRHGSLTPAIESLVNDGTVTRTWVTKPGKPHHVYALSGVTPPSAQR